MYLGGRFGSLVPDWIQEAKETEGAKRTARFLTRKPRVRRPERGAAGLCFGHTESKITVCHPEASSKHRP